MGVNILPKTDTRQRCNCNLNPGHSATESSMLTTRLPHYSLSFISLSRRVCWHLSCSAYGLHRNELN